MLFDLRGGGRRRVVQGTYLFLALLIGGGLVLFGIGGSGLGGGLVDAITNGNGSGPTGNAAYEKRVKQATAQTRANPKNAAAWATLARARYQLASSPDEFDSSTGVWNAAGKRQLSMASQAWQRHLAVAKHPDDGVASLMVNAYSEAGLNQPAKAVDAQEVITEARPTSATFAKLAVLAYTAGQSRKGDLAEQKALSLTDKDLRANLKSQIDAAKAQALQSAAGASAQSATPSATPSAAPSATATPKAGSKAKKKK